MLDKLGEIDWIKHYGANRIGNELPKQIENLFSDDLAVREKAQAIVFEEIAHQNTVYPATPLVVPFLIKLLDIPDYDVFWVLELLNKVMKGCFAQLGFGFSSKPYRISNQYLKRCYESYSNIALGYELFRGFSRHASAEVRYSAVNLLARIPERYSLTRFEFRRLLAVETNPVVTSLILMRLTDIVPWDRRPYLSQRDTRLRPLLLKGLYIELIKPFMSDEQDRLTQLIAVQAWGKLQGTRPLSVPDKVIDIYFEAFNHPIKIKNLVNYIRYNDFYLDDYVHPHLVLGKITSLGIGQIAQHLCSDILSAEYVHYLVRELLERISLDGYIKVSSFLLSDFRKWKHLDGGVSSPFSYHEYQSDERIENNRIYYKTEKGKRHTYSAGKQLLIMYKREIQVIVDCNKFWEIESNLFSFFYALPDDREALQQLLQ